MPGSSIIFIYLSYIYSPLSFFLVCLLVCLFLFYITVFSLILHPLSLSLNYPPFLISCSFIGYFLFHLSLSSSFTFHTKKFFPFFHLFFLFQLCSNSRTFVIYIFFSFTLILFSYSSVSHNNFRFPSFLPSLHI